MFSIALDFRAFYAMFHLPTVEFDCGEKCAPYNEGGVPFCCDTRHAVPTAYESEWEYLQKNTTLWHIWRSSDDDKSARLTAQCPPGQILVECQGNQLCQRNFRTLTCRAFPFFPYISRERIFLGLSYYWEYEDRCWILSHLDQVSRAYRQAFIESFSTLFDKNPEEFDNFRYHSMIMRRIYGRKGRAVPLLHRNGKNYKVTPRNGRMRLAQPGQFPMFDPYRIAENLTFKDEFNGSNYTTS
jgi:hypothetical protein